MSSSGALLFNIPVWQPNTFYPQNFVVQVSGVFYASKLDHVSGSTWTGSQTNWNSVTPAGIELASAESTSAAGLTTAEADLAGLSITFTAPNRPVRLELWAYTVQQLTSAGTPLLKITDGAATTAYAVALAGSLAINGYSAALLARRRLNTLTPGQSYTFKARGSTSAATANVLGGSYYPISLSAVML